MRSLKMIALGLLVLPAAELAAFVVVAGLVGFPTALGLLILASVCGVLVLRRLGANTAIRSSSRAPGGAVTWLALEGRDAAVGLGGILLVIPGFISAILGLAIIAPVSRRLLLAAGRRCFSATYRPAGPEIVDLVPDEWQHLPDPQLRSHRPGGEP